MTLRISDDWLTRSETRAVCDALTAAGHRALFVGGCVRNALMGHPVSDVDIATDARPDRVVQLAGAAGLKAVPTGIDHGTITVVSGHLPYEVTTFRRDVETFGRHAKVVFGDSLTDDAARRDFTMNALYADPAGELIDPLSGLPDLLARRVRFVGDPTARITEDYLRILRFFRFHAHYGDPHEGLDPDGLAACADGAEGIDGLSRERIGAEMKKLLSAQDPAPAVAAMRAAGVLTRVLPGADPSPLAPLVHLESLHGLAPDYRCRLAVLGGDDPSGRLRLSRQDAKVLEILSTAARECADPAELGYRHGDQTATCAILARGALLGAAPADDWREAVERGAQAKFPVRAADLMPDLKGPALGKRLAEIEARWIASGFTLDRAALLR